MSYRPGEGVGKWLTGFEVDGADPKTNFSGDTYMSWSFANKPRFCTMIWYDGNGVTGRALEHNLGVQPGMVIIKRKRIKKLAGLPRLYRA